MRHVASTLHDATEDTMQKIRMELKRQAVTLVVVERKTIQDFFKACGCRNKHQIASRLSLDLPILKWMVPKPRRPWNPEPHTTIVFDAVATDAVYQAGIA
jgi:hypothetical protein